MIYTIVAESRNTYMYEYFSFKKYNIAEHLNAKSFSALKRIK